MRRFNSSAVVFAFVLLVAAPALFAGTASPAPETDGSAISKPAPSKLCHPKKPLTCRANQLAAAWATTTPKAVEPSTEVAAEDTSRLCAPPRYYCVAEAVLKVEPAKEAETLSIAAEDTSRLCAPPRYYCQSVI